ncbi:hypothetical protein GUI12_03430 [Anaplasmataceae bacterium AB001_6]|nr:hypothetical protein GUI12_03430 [Anaplasmataceae bacterium AB001_6]
MSLTALSFSWYIFRVRSGAEDQIERFILTRYSDDSDFGEIYIPREDFGDIIENDVSKKKIRKVFPGYVFIRMRPSDRFLNKVLSIPKLYKFSSGDNGNGLRIIDDIEIDKIKNNIQAIEHSKTSSLQLQIGDVVKIIGGSFSGVKARIVSVSKENKQVVAVIELLGSTAEINLGFDQIEKED